MSHFILTDSSSFGRKMLEKMGWKSGQGLGLNNDGTTSHIKIAVKDDNLGIGASQKDAETGWLNNSKSYQEVLDRLSKSCDSGENVEKEEKKKHKKDKKKSDKSDKKVKKEKKESKKTKKSKKTESSESESETDSSSDSDAPNATSATAKPTILKSAHRAKFIRNKAVSSYSEAHLKEILGGFNI